METWPQALIALYLLVLFVRNLHITARQLGGSVGWFLFDILLTAFLVWVFHVGGFWSVWGW